MIRFNWKRKSDGEPLAKVRVEHLLTRQDMAHLLAAKVRPFDQESMREMSRQEIDTAIRDQLWQNPDGRHWWTDDYSEEYPHEVTADEVLEWAERQVAKL